MIGAMGRGKSNSSLRADFACVWVGKKSVSGCWGAQFSIEEQPLSRNVKGVRGGFVFKAHRPLYHSTLGSKVIKKKKC